MFAIFDLLAIPLGYVMRWIYQLLPNYFVALFLFTLLFRLLMFPLSLKSQKSQADRARLQPRLERLQKKYGQDQKKLQQKQMELYEKEGVSMTGGCLPSLVQMILLFGVIAVIYKPLTHMHQIPQDVISACEAAVVKVEVPENATAEEKAAIEKKNEHKEDKKQMTGYYAELRMMRLLKENKDDALTELGRLDAETLGGITPQEYYEKILKAGDDFSYGSISLLDQPWDSSKSFGGISVLWLIPLLSGLTAVGSMLLSQYYTKALTGSKAGEKQPGQGCTNGMLYFMPLFSLYITFIVPCGVGIYWIFSNVLAVVQTYVLNRIYNPVKIREQAEQEYQERRRKKAEAKKRLAEARKREQRENALAEQENKTGAAEPKKEKKLTAQQRNQLLEQQAREEAAAKEAGEAGTNETPADTAADAADSPETAAGSDDTETGAQ